MIISQTRLEAEAREAFRRTRKQSGTDDDIWVGFTIGVLEFDVNIWWDGEKRTWILQVYPVYECLTNDEVCLLEFEMWEFSPEFWSDYWAHREEMNGHS